MAGSASLSVKSRNYPGPYLSADLFVNRFARRIGYDDFHKVLEFWEKCIANIILVMSEIKTA
jgi:hypothetical protein